MQIPTGTLKKIISAKQYPNEYNSVLPSPGHKLSGGYQQPKKIKLKGKALLQEQRERQERLKQINMGGSVQN